MDIKNVNVNKKIYVLDEKEYDDLCMKYDCGRELCRIDSSLNDIEVQITRSTAFHYLGLAFTILAGCSLAIIAVCLFVMLVNGQV